MNNKIENEKVCETIGAMLGGLFLPAVAFAATMSGPIGAVSFGIGILGGGFGGKQLDKMIDSKNRNSNMIENKYR